MEKLKDSSICTSLYYILKQYVLANSSSETLVHLKDVKTAKDSTASPESLPWPQRFAHFCCRRTPPGRGRRGVWVGSVGFCPEALLACSEGELLPLRVAGADRRKKQGADRRKDLAVLAI
ncbi:hypothetical protein MRB53_020929 [Persea americana]|uniref:Uncharacterized protein n=1 Tax=Persea americana TaxID=3435 RepID=A0ACC2L2N4_PERAE|nr:hypothetical protein MRB53_020929 [Persea americana]